MVERFKKLLRNVFVYYFVWVSMWSYGRLLWCDFLQSLDDYVTEYPLFSHKQPSVPFYRNT